MTRAESLIIAAAAVGARYLDWLGGLETKSNTHHDARGRFTSGSGRGARRGNRAHQSPRSVRGPEHADLLKHQHRQRREHAHDLRGERRQLRREQASERRQMVARHERESTKLDRGQGREADRLNIRHHREAAKHPDSPALGARHTEERADLEATHRQERHDMASEQRTERQSLRNEHAEARRSQREDHLESIADLRRSQRDDLAETLRGVRADRDLAREEAAGKGLSLPVLTKDRDAPDADDEDNTYGLPAGDDIAAELQRWFRRQLRFVLGEVPTVGDPLPEEMPELGEEYDAPMARAFTPLISAYWDTAGEEIREKFGVEPDAWERSWTVTDPHVREKIRGATLSFCEVTNATTTTTLGNALKRLRKELEEGIVDEGESIPELTERVKSVFEHAETWRAENIARTETARAVHAAAYESVKDSGVVVGSRWLLSSNACPLCHKIAAEVNQVKLGKNFAVIGDNADYKDIAYPPAHVRCRCSLEHVLSEEYGGPADPEWGKTLVQPEITEEDEARADAAAVR